MLNHLLHNGVQLTSMHVTNNSFEFTRNYFTGAIDVI
jgi:hypothetical protein